MEGATSFFQDMLYYVQVTPFTPGIFVLSVVCTPHPLRQTWAFYYHLQVPSRLPSSQLLYSVLFPPDYVQHGQFTSLLIAQGVHKFKWARNGER